MSLSNQVFLERESSNYRGNYECLKVPLDRAALVLEEIVWKEEFKEAASWAVQAARSPGAHVLIEMIAAATCHLSGDDVRAKAWARSARSREPDFTQAQFFNAFPFREQRTRTCMAGALKHCGF